MMSLVENIFHICTVTAWQLTIADTDIFLFTNVLLTISDTSWYFLKCILTIDNNVLIHLAIAEVTTIDTIKKNFTVVIKKRKWKNVKKWRREREKREGSASKATTSQGNGTRCYCNSAPIFICLRLMNSDSARERYAFHVSFLVPASFSFSHLRPQRRSLEVAKYRLCRLRTVLVRTYIRGVRPVQITHWHWQFSHSLHKLFFLRPMFGVTKKSFVFTKKCPNFCLIKITV